MTREEAIQVLKSISAHNLNEVVDALYMAIEALQTPPISQRSMYQAGYRQAQEDRPRGHWIDMADFEQCSECRGTHLKEVDTYYGKATWIKTDFCPNCGADMRGEDE